MVPESPVVEVTFLLLSYTPWVDTCNLLYLSTPAPIIKRRLFLMPGA